MIDVTAFGVSTADMARSAGTLHVAAAARAHRNRRTDAETGASVDRDSTR